MLRGPAGKHTQKVLKIPYIYETSGLDVLIPQVKEGFQKLAEDLGRKGVVRAAPGLTQWVQTGDVLLIQHPFPPEETVYLGDVLRHLPGHHRQQVEVNLMALEQPGGPQCAAEGTAALRVPAQRVVQGLAAVQGQADKEAVLLKESRPAAVQHKPIGLKGVVYAHIVHVIFLLVLYSQPEELQPPQGGLAALEPKSTLAAGVVQGLSYQCFQGVLGHHAIGGHGAVHSLVVVEAVGAAHIATARGGLYKYGEWGHGYAPFFLEKFSIYYSIFWKNMLYLSGEKWEFPRRSVRLCV